MEWYEDNDMDLFDDQELFEELLAARRRFRDSIGMRNKEVGRQGEQAAARYLGLCGYEILERNWVCPAGEADIIARDGDYLVFVEVKTRLQSDKGLPEEAVDAEKRRRYELIACWYLRTVNETDFPFRFDVISIMVIGEDKAVLRHHVNAFGTGECL